MRTALVVLIVCAAIDLLAVTLLLALVWLTHRQMRREAAAQGEAIPSAAGQFGCLIALAVAGIVVLYGAAWLLFQ